MTSVPQRIAYYGGTFDPPHCGHLSIARNISDLFRLDRFVFIPAFHAPHKPDSEPTSAYHRYTMLCLATEDDPDLAVSLMEIQTGQKRYSLDTLSELTRKDPDQRMYFVMGADSWRDITTWHEWEKVLLMTSHIVVTRPGYKIGFDHVTPTIKDRVTDLRDLDDKTAREAIDSAGETDRIFITDAVNFDVSATSIREDVQEDNVLDRTDDVPEKVAKYIEKYDLYT